MQMDKFLEHLENLYWIYTDTKDKVWNMEQNKGKIIPLRLQAIRGYWCGHLNLCIDLNCVQNRTKLQRIY